MLNFVKKQFGPPDSGETPKRNNAIADGWKSIASTVAILIIAPILAIFVMVYVFQSYEVYGESMETSLQNGDRLIVQKFSKNWASLLGNDYLPKRGEIIVFDRPSFISDPSGEVDHLIKRVVGLPGERVVVIDGKITIYNEEKPEGFNPDKLEDYGKDILFTPGNVDITVGKNEVFVVGDNRSNSKDSRSFGAINVSTITGVATIRFIPVNNFEKL